MVLGAVIQVKIKILFKIISASIYSCPKNPNGLPQSDLQDKMKNLDKSVNCECALLKCLFKTILKNV